MELNFPHVYVKFAVSVIAHDADAEGNQKIATKETFASLIIQHKVISFYSLHVLLSLLLFHPF